MGQDIGICIVCFGLLVVFCIIVPTHTKNYAKAYIKHLLCTTVSESRYLHTVYLNPDL